MKGFVFCFIILALAAEVTRCDDARIPRDERYLMMLETTRHAIATRLVEGLVARVPDDFSLASSPVVLSVSEDLFTARIRSLAAEICSKRFGYKCRAGKQGEFREIKIHSLEQEYREKERARQDAADAVRVCESRHWYMFFFNKPCGYERLRIASDRSLRAWDHLERARDATLTQRPDNFLIAYPAPQDLY